MTDFQHLLFVEKIVRYRIKIKMTPDICQGHSYIVIGEITITYRDSSVPPGR